MINLKFKKILSFLALPLVFLYKTASLFRFYLYKTGVLKSYNVNCPVISVGNIEMGGGGKTPFLIWFVEKLLKKGYRPVVISRGYKRLNEREQIVIDPAMADDPDPSIVGDEPAMIRSKLPRVPIILNADRVSAADSAIERFKPDLILLDDGFQHHRLKRKLDIVVIPSRPSLWKREFRGALKRADIIVFSSDSNPPRIEDKPIFSMRRYIDSAVRIADGERKEISFFKNKKITAVAGIADPEQFFRMLDNTGLNICEKIPLSDHYVYSSKSIRLFERIVKKVDCEYILTTYKDSVKIKRTDFNKNLWYSARLGIDVDGEKELFELIVALI